MYLLLGRSSSTHHIYSMRSRFHHNCSATCKIVKYSFGTDFSTVMRPSPQITASRPPRDRVFVLTFATPTFASCPFSALCLFIHLLPVAKLQNLSFVFRKFYNIGAIPRPQTCTRCSRRDFYTSFSFPFCVLYTHFRPDSRRWNPALRAVVPSWATFPNATSMR